MKKIFVSILLLSLFIVVWCNITNKNNNEYKLTWNVEINEISWDSQTFNDKKDDIPLCEEVDLIPFDELDVINVDDVVENCEYEDAYTFYSPYGWWWSDDMWILYKNWLWVNFTRGKWEQPFCIWSGWYIYYNASDAWYPWLFEFLQKWNVVDKKYIRSIKLNTDNFHYIQSLYDCFDDSVCKQFVSIPWWESEWHFYFYWMVWENSSWENVFVFDNNIYNLWVNEFLDLNNNWVSTIKQTSRKINRIIWDKIIVKRWLNWELMDSFTSFDNINRNELDERVFYKNEKIILWKFQLQTCEIKL